MRRLLSTTKLPWIHHFDNVSGVIFVVALNHYNAVLFEDESRNAPSHFEWLLRPGVQENGSAVREQQRDGVAEPVVHVFGTHGEECQTQEKHAKRHVQQRHAEQGPSAPGRGVAPFAASRRRTAFGTPHLL